jgi:hypothetical protein
MGAADHFLRWMKDFSFLGANHQVREPQPGQPRSKAARSSTRLHFLQVAGGRLNDDVVFSIGD